MSQGPSQPQGRGSADNSLYRASVCPCCGAPVKANLFQCEYCDTPIVRNMPQQPQQTVRVVTQPVQIVTSQQAYDRNYNDQFEQQMMMQNQQAQIIANAQIKAAAIKGGSRIASAIIRNLF